MTCWSHLPFISPNVPSRPDKSSYNDYSCHTGRNQHPIKGVPSCYGETKSLGNYLVFSTLHAM